MKKLATILLLFCLIGTLFVPAASAASSDTQVTIEQTVKALGIMTGDANGNMNLFSNVTRAEFSKMLVAASVYKDSIGDSSGISPFKDVKYTHWAAEYVKTAVDAGWVVGYVDGTFRPSNTIKLEEAATAVLKLLGYTSADLIGTYPSAQLSKFRALGLSDGITKTAGQLLSRNDCMILFYNLMGAKTKSGTTYAQTLGYTVNSAGQIDYSSLISANTTGPYVVQDSTWLSTLPFASQSAVVYRNGKLSDLSAVSQYDVIYYNKGIRTVWAYGNRVVGLYTAASPSTTSPESVTVAGNSYKIGTSSAAYQLSTMGEYGIGDTVTLLLGMNGEAVDVLSAIEGDTIKYGVVVTTGNETYKTDANATQTVYMVSIACTDGIVRQYSGISTSFAPGDLVSVGYRNGSVSAQKLPGKGIGGKVGANGKTLGNYTFSDDVEIIDTSENGDYMVVYPSRLAGVTLDSSSVRYYMLNDSNEISQLILNDATGDLHTYGILTDVTNTGSSDSMGSLSGSYQYLINGVSGKITTTNSVLNVSKGPAIIIYKGSAISSMKNLIGVGITEIGSLNAQSGSNQYAISDNVQVYLKKDNDYYLTNLTAVSDTAKYSLQGYYENGFAAGGRIRIIIATLK